MNSLSHSNPFFANVTIMPLRSRIRHISLTILPTSLLIVLTAILALQFIEVGRASEILSLSSFVILISFSALALNWCRAPGSLTQENQLREIYHAGIDCFIASILALLSTFFTWIRFTPLFQGSILSLILFLLHWIFLLLAIGLFALSLLQLLRTATEIFRVNKE